MRNLLTILLLFLFAGTANAQLFPKKYGKLYDIGEAPKVVKIVNDNMALPTDCKDLFLMTDDYRSLKGFSNSNLRLHTFAKSNQTGHSTKKRIARPFTRSEVIQLLAEVEIASRSDVFVGTMSSNVSRFITLKHSSFNDCVSLDRSWHAL